VMEGGDRSWVARKLNTVRRFGRSSFLVGRQNDLKGGAWHVDAAEYADHGGAFPIRIQVCSPIHLLRRGLTARRACSTRSAR
jgi:uncharacterized protein (UPF0303 family)